MSPEEKAWASAVTRMLQRIDKDTFDTLWDEEKASMRLAREKLRADLGLPEGTKNIIVPPEPEKEEGDEQK